MNIYKIGKGSSNKPVENRPSDELEGYGHSAPQVSVVEEAESSLTTKRDAEGNIVSKCQKTNEVMPTLPFTALNTNTTEKSEETLKTKKLKTTIQKELKSLNSFLSKCYVFQSFLLASSGLT